jgi:hypothetical protein
MVMLIGMPLLRPAPWLTFRNQTFLIESVAFIKMSGTTKYDGFPQYCFASFVKRPDFSNNPTGIELTNHKKDILI